MSKVIDELLPIDFGRTFDSQLFERWKQSMNEQAKAGFIALALQIGGLILLVLLGGLIGLALLFAALIIAMVIALSRRKAVKQYQNQLGITNTELKQALAACRRRI